MFRTFQGSYFNDFVRRDLPSSKKLYSVFLRTGRATVAPYPGSYMQLQYVIVLHCLDCIDSVWIKFEFVCYDVSDKVVTTHFSPGLLSCVA